MKSGFESRVNVGRYVWCWYAGLFARYRDSLGALVIYGDHVRGLGDYMRGIFQFRPQLQNFIRILTVIKCTLLKVKHIATAHQKFTAKYNWSGKMVHNYK